MMPAPAGTDPRSLSATPGVLSPVTVSRAVPPHGPSEANPTHRREEATAATH